MRDLNAFITQTPKLAAELAMESEERFARGTSTKTKLLSLNWALKLS